MEPFVMPCGCGGRIWEKGIAFLPGFVRGYTIVNRKVFESENIPTYETHVGVLCACDSCPLIMMRELLVDDINPEPPPIGRPFYLPSLDEPKHPWCKCYDALSRIRIRKSGTKREGKATGSGAT